MNGPALFGAAVLALTALAGPDPASAQSTTTTINYVVRPGDTLSGLADRYLVRPGAYHEVARLNRVHEPRRLPVGRILRLPVPLLRSEPAQARIATVRGPVSVQRDGAGSAGAAAVGQTLVEGDLISTGANAFIRLALPDGGFVSLPSRSRVRVRRLRTILLNGATDQVFQLESGRVESDASPVREPGGFSIATPISISAVRGTGFRNSYDPEAQRGGTEVIEGVVAVESGSSEIMAREAQGVTAGPGGLALAALLPAPDLMDPDAVQTGEAVALRFVPAPGAVRHRARLATDAGMVDAFAEAESPEGEAGITFTDLEDGLYFVRVSAVSAEGLEGLAKVYTLLRARSGLGNLAATTSGAGRDRQYLFRWEPAGDGPAEFRFQLRKDAEPPVVDEAGLTEPRLTLTGLPPGEYQWRVRITRRRFDRLIESWSEPQALRIGR